MSSSIIDGQQPSSSFIQLLLRVAGVLDLLEHQPYIKPYMSTHHDRPTMRKITAYHQAFFHLKGGRMTLHLLAINYLLTFCLKGKGLMR